MFERTSAILALLLSTIQAGCLTERTYREFEVAPLEAGWVELLEATSSSVRLSVSMRYRAMLPRKSLIEFDPRLERCAAIRVLARTGTADLYLTPGVRHALDVDREVLDRKASDWQSSGELADDCTVAILFSTYGDDVSLAAENIQGRLGGTVIHSPKNVLVLALLLPAAVVADVAISVPLLVLACFTGDADCTWMGPIFAPVIEGRL